MQTDALSYRPILQNIAYNIVGCSAIAEDLVQDTFVNWFKVERKNIANSKAYLISSVRNISLNYLKKKKEELFDNVMPTLPSFRITADYSYLDIKQEISESLAIMFKKLAPAERAVFLLKEVFNFDYNELPEIVGKKSENCRKLFSRAQQKLADEKERFHIEQKKLTSFIADFKNASLGEFSGLIERLKEDISKSN